MSPASPRTGFSSGCRNRRVGGAEKEDAGDADALQGLAEDAGLEGRDAGGDVGELGHWLQLAAGAVVMQSQIANTPLRIGKKGACFSL